MANASTTGFGLRMVMNVGNTPATSGQSEYKIQTAPGVASNKGDPMNIQDAGNTGFIQDVAFTTLDNGGVGGTAWSTAGGNAEPGCIGVFNGAFFIDSTGKPTFANNVVASQATSKDYNTGSNDIIAFVNDNPMQEYVVKADAAVAQSLIGAANAMNMNNYTATDNKDGQSISTLDVGSASTTAQFRLVRYANDPENKDATAPGVNLIVSFLPSSMLYN
jgi:hypothetical protein|tara:strand:+ start:238 stop:894 length:657 start_codon:yes stop_codon:yes gene_type:complete